MLFLRLFFIITVVYAKEKWINNYIVHVDEKGELRSVETTVESSKNLDLSNLEIKSIAVNAFTSNLSNLETLDLSGNKINYLSEPVFSNLTNLRNLSLANNKLSEASKAFLGLENLVNLDLSDNALYQFRDRGFFFGLSDKCDIVISGNYLFDIKSDVFDDYRVEEKIKVEEEEEEEDEESNRRDDKTDRDGSDDGESGKKKDWSNVRLIVCLKDRVSIDYVGYLNENESLPIGCKNARLATRVPFDWKKVHLNLDRMNIERFEIGWYRLEDYPITGISIRGNKIALLTDHMFDELPKNIGIVELSNNKIETIKNCSFVNDHLRELWIRNNLIDQIDDGAFAKMNLKVLRLESNRLNGTRFIETLPKSLEDLCLTDNLITDLEADSFGNLVNLVSLKLDQNDIVDIADGAFNGLFNLKLLVLSRTNLVTIASGAFRDLTRLKLLDLDENKIVDLENGVFASLKNLRELHLNGNGLKRFKRHILGDMNNLEKLHLGHNRITSLESRDNSGTNETGLEDEKSSVFDLPKLTHLDLRFNQLREIRDEFFEGLSSIKYLGLTNNEIVEIGKNFGRSMPTLEILHLSKNRIVGLETGTFVGSPKHRLDLNDNKISIIANGSFALPNLRTLSIKGNRLSHLKAEMFEHLDNLAYLVLADNGISHIPIGFTRYLRELTHLDLSYNTFDILKNGALCGLGGPHEASWVDVQGVSLKIIQAGVFSVKYCPFLSK